MRTRPRAFSSAGSEHLPYKQRVGGSNPSTPTSNFSLVLTSIAFWAFSSAGSEHLPYKQRVGGSNPSTPTSKSQLKTNFPFGRLAQLVQSICLTSRGSAVRIRQRPHRIKLSNSPFGRLAQLVQSICLTSRGSAVRIRQRPLPLNLTSSLEFYIHFQSLI